MGDDCSEDVPSTDDSDFANVLLGTMMLFVVYLF